MVFMGLPVSSEPECRKTVLKVSEEKTQVNFIDFK
jgi:hypothetical protein